MSFGGLILTNSGRNKIAGALSENNALNFTHVKLGDGTYNGSFSSITKLTSEVMELPITNVTQKDNEVIIDCDWNSNDAPKGFYLREIGIIGNGVLCYYDNTGSADAEYIDPESKVVAKQKRLRFTLIISSEVNVTTKISSGLYALSETVTQEMKELDDKKLNKNDISDWAKKPEKPSYTKEEIGLGNVPNVATNDQTPSYTEATTLTKLTSGEKLCVAFGKISKAITDLIVHIEDSVKHITSAERTLWNTVSNKVDKVSGKGLSTNDYTTTEKNKLARIASGAEVNVQSDWNVTDTSSDTYIKNKPSIYTKNEVDNKLSTLETNIDWKEAVATYNDIATTYPSPQDGWTVNVKDTDYTYRYNGTSWVAISANAIPKATNSVDGLLSKEDHAKYEDANSKKHTHSNKSIIDKITQALLDNWNSAKTHADSAHAPSNAQANVIESVKVNGAALIPNAKAVDIAVPTKTSQLTNDSGFKTTDTTYGAATQSASGLMSAGDKKKLDGIDSGANAYSLPLMTSSVRGGAKIGYSTNGKNYPVQLNGSGQMFVNVPWLDTNTWRGIQDNLTSTSTTDSLSARQGKLLAEQVESAATDGSDAMRILGEIEPWYMAKKSWKLAYSSVMASQGSGFNVGQYMSNNSYVTEFNIICEAIASSGTRYVYTYILSITAYNDFVGSGGTTTIIQGYSASGFTGRCEIAITKPYIKLNTLYVGNTSYTGSQAIMKIYAK